MSTTSKVPTTDEAAIMGLRAQILDNIRVIKSAVPEPILTTFYDSTKGWGAVIFDGRQGFPIYSTLGSDTTMVAALREMLQYTSEKILARVKQDGGLI